MVYLEIGFDNQTEETLTIKDVRIDHFDFWNTLGYEGPDEVFKDVVINPGEFFGRRVEVRRAAKSAPILFTLHYDDNTVDILKPICGGVMWCSFTNQDNYYPIVTDSKSYRMWTVTNYDVIEQYPSEGYIPGTEGTIKVNGKEQYSQAVFITEKIDHAISVTLNTYYNFIQSKVAIPLAFHMHIKIEYTKDQLKQRAEVVSLAQNLCKILQKNYQQAKELLAEIVKETDDSGISAQANSMLSDAHEAEANDNLTKIDNLLNSSNYDHTEIENLYAKTISGYEEAKRLNRAKTGALNQKIRDVKLLQKNNKRHNELTEQSGVVLDKLDNLVKTNDPKDRRQVIKDLDGLITEFQLVKNGYKKGQKGDLNVEVASKMIHKQITVMKNIVLKLHKDQLDSNMGSLNFQGLYQKQDSTLKGHVEYVRQIDFK